MKTESDVLNYLPRQSNQDIIGIGDDAAVLENGLVVCVDTLVEGVHFLKETSEADVAYKLLAVNLSDMAAMGALPQHALLSVAISKGFNIKLFMNELLIQCRQWGVTLVGGDTVSSPTSVVSLTLLGHAESVALRSGARAGDVVIVTGPFGGAVASQRHLKPTPRVSEGKELVSLGVKCLMDASDGLAQALYEIARLSSVKIRVIESQIPLHECIEHLDFNQRLKSAYYEGEDFELVATVSKDDFIKLEQSNLDYYVIGEVVDGHGVIRVDGQGDSTPLPQGGYQHQW